MLTVYFDKGALVRFGVQITLAPTLAQIAAAVPVLLLRKSGYAWPNDWEIVTAAPLAGYWILADPTTLRLRVLDPSAVETEYVYGTSTEIVRDDIGQFHADIAAAVVAGTWRYRWEATGIGASVNEEPYVVNPSGFP